MNIEDIKALAQIMKENDLTCLEVNEDEFEITLKREQSTLVNQSTCYIPQATQMPQTAQIPQEPQKPAPQEQPDNYSNAKEIKSPMVGVFYNAASPEDGPFVKVGDTVKKGDTVCVIETMKLFNEITAEFDGTIIDICADNEQVVEFGQTLFRVLP